MTGVQTCALPIYVKKKKRTRKVPQYRTWTTPNPAKGASTYIWAVHKNDDKELAMRENESLYIDSRQMALLPDYSVHLAITSPPYWQLKDYGTDNQIGFHDSYENYINNLNLVWKECYRTLHNGCRLCVNIGDQFARAVYYGRYKVIPIREEIGRAHV